MSRPATRPAGRPARALATIVLLLLQAASGERLCSGAAGSGQFRRDTGPAGRFHAAREPDQGPNSARGAAEPPREKTIALKVLDPNGQPVKDFVAGCSILNNDVPATKIPFGYLSVPRKRLKTYTAGGVAGSSRSFPNDQATPHPDRAALCVLHKRRGLCAIRQISRQDLGTTVEVRLEPACRVHGRMGCSALERAGVYLGQARLDVYWNSYNPLRCQARPPYPSGPREEFFKSFHPFEFFLPPGRYGIRARSSAVTGTKELLFTVEPGRTELDLGLIDLPAASAARLIGQKAPPIGPVAEWVNGEPLDLARTTGKLVLLCFGKAPQRPPRDQPASTGRGTRSSVSPVRRSRRFGPLFPLPGRPRSGGSRGGGAASGAIDDETLQLEPLLTLKKLYGDDLLIAALYEPGSTRELKNMLAVLKADVRGRIGLSVAVDARAAEPNQPPVTRSRYHIQDKLTYVLIDRNGIIAGALDQVPSGEQIDRVFKLEPAWRRNFERAYRLDPGQCIRHLPKPPLSARLGYWRSHPLARFAPDPPQTIIFALENGRTVEKKTFGADSPGAIAEFFELMLGADAVDMKLQHRGNTPYGITIKGDWLLEPQATFIQKTEALQNIFARGRGRRLAFTLQHRNLTTIRISGRYRRQQDSGLIHVFVGRYDPRNTSVVFGADSVMRMLLDLAERTGVEMVVEAVDFDSPAVRYTVADDVARIAGLTNWPQTAQKLRAMLNNIARQTGLDFELAMQTRRVVTVHEPQSGARPNQRR